MMGGRGGGSLVYTSLMESIHNLVSEVKCLAQLKGLSRENRKCNLLAFFKQVSVKKCNLNLLIVSGSCSYFSCLSAVFYNVL